jgi:hypothetical protein
LCFAIWFTSKVKLAEPKVEPADDHLSHLRKKPKKITPIKHPKVFIHMGYGPFHWSKRKKIPWHLD